MCCFALWLLCLFALDSVQRKGCWMCPKLQNKNIKHCLIFFQSFLLLNIKWKMHQVKREKLLRIIMQVIKIASPTQPQIQCSQYLKERHFHYSQSITHQQDLSIESKEYYYRAEPTLGTYHCSKVWAGNKTVIADTVCTPCMDFSMTEFGGHGAKAGAQLTSTTTSFYSETGNA